MRSIVRCNPGEGESPHIRRQNLRKQPLTQPSPREERGEGTHRILGYDGVPIPSFFSASSIRCGGGILMTSACPVSKRLFRLERIAGQP
jgi:hypothetical protein